MSPKIAQFAPAPVGSYRDITTLKCQRGVNQSERLKIAGRSSPRAGEQWLFCVEISLTIFDGAF